MKEDRFARIPLALPDGSRQAYLLTSYRKLVKALGKPDTHEEGKVAFTWTFQNARTGAKVGLWDYKLTSIYEPGFPTPAELKRMQRVEWSIIARDRHQAKLFAQALVNATDGEIIWE